MNNEDRQFIAAKLAAREKPENIAHDLLVRRALEEVEKVAAEMAYAEAQNQWAMGQRYYTLFGPLPKPVKVKEADGRELWQRPGRQQYQVKVSEFPQFCRENKLDLKAMTEVVTGKRWDHNDWLCVWSGASMDAGQQATPPEIVERQRLLIGL